MFNIPLPFDNGDFSYYFTDIFATHIQYGSRVSMCETLTKGAGTPETLMQTVKEMAVSEGMNFDTYDAEGVLSSTKVDINQAGRQWTYMYCNEFGFFITPNSE